MAFGGPSVAMSVSSHPSPAQTWWILSNFGTTLRSFEMLTALEAADLEQSSQLSSIMQAIRRRAEEGKHHIVVPRISIDNTVKHKLTLLGYTVEDVSDSDVGFKLKFPGSYTLIEWG
jgi:histidine ammonia-lyase